jgi:uncharacterized repeat protein (TIGR01451 family)
VNISSPVAYVRRRLVLILSFALLVSILPLSRFLRVVPTAHAAAFTPGNLVVYRVGTGSGALGTSAAAVFLDEYTPGGTLVQTIAMPTAVAGSNKRLTAAGSSTSEGLLTRSADGQYLVLAGYDADVGTANVSGTTSASVSRVIGRVDASGAVNTSTALTDAISQGNPRSAASTNGTDLWISGTSSGGGIRYATLGSTTSTQISTTPTNLRQLNIVGGQLYVTSMSGTARLATIGTGTPTTGSQTITNLTGLDSTNVNGPYGFFFADLSGAVAGNDTLYVADESSNIIRKFSLVSGSWTANGSVSSTAVRGLTGAANGGGVTLYVTSNGTTLSSLTDASGYNATITGSLTTLVTAATNTVFRGVAFAPGSGGGGTPTNPSGTGAANPSTLPAGNSTRLTVTVTPGANPASTGLAVTCNLSSIGASSAQQFFDDGTNGDQTIGDNVFTFDATVAAGTTAGAKSLPVSITDAQSRAASASISLTVQTPPTITAINQIQGSLGTSPYAGQSVTTTGVVTALKSSGFFLQTAQGADDGNANTSEGVYVFTSSAPTVGVGQMLTVTGTVAEFAGSATLPGTLTELTSPSITVNSTGNPLPAAVTVTTSMLNPAGSFDQLERFESMRLHADTLVTVAPTNDFGEIYCVLQGVTRPMREPGLEIRQPVPPDPTSGTPDCCIPRFDENPERIMVDSDGLAGSSVISVTSNVTLSNVTGPLDFTFGDYKIDPETPPSKTANMSAVAVPVPEADEFTVAGYNIENFANDPTQRKKAALAIRNVMRYPDVIGHVEILNLATLQALAAQVNSDALAAGDPNPLYEARLIPAPGGGTQHLGFLVKTSRVQIDSVTQERASETWVDPGGTTALLHDRPPLVLHATLLPASANPHQFVVVVNHPRSFIDVGLLTSVGERVRAKRKAQSESIAGLLQELQAANPATPIIAVGDYNAFQFNDGYTDPVDTIKGVPTPDEQMVVDQSPDLVTPDFVNLVDELPADQRYSFVFGGTPQALDHVIVNTVAHALVRRIAVARNNSDFPADATFASDATRPERNSDHDMPVAYFSFPQPANADLEVSMTASRNPAPVGLNFNYNITVSNTGLAAAAGVVVTDHLPSPVTLTAATTSQGACAFDSPSRTVTCSLGALASSSSASIQLTVKPREEGTLDNTASATTTDAEPDTSDNSASVNGLPAVKETDLSVQKTSAPNPVFVSQNVTYTMVVKNNSTVVGATGVVLTDSLPASMKFVSATTNRGSLITPPVGSSGVVTANIGSLGIGATATVTVTVTSSAAGVITNTATVTGNESDPFAANNTDSSTTTVNTVNLQKALLAKQVLTGGCENTTGNVYLTGPAPAGGLTVSLSTSSLAGVTVPASVFIPAGQMVSPAFNVTTSPVVTKQVGLVTATLGISSVSRGLTINVGSGTCPP